jgi:putative ABC transport system permease protein
MAFYLAFKEVWRNRGRFFLFSLVIALITTLVLFIAALGEGLGLANKEYLSKIDAQLIAFQANVKLVANTSQITESKVNSIARVAGVNNVGTLGLSSATLVFPGTGRADLSVSLIGLEAGKPGTPQLIEGKNLEYNKASQVIIDRRIASKENLRVGDMLKIKTIQDTKEKFFDLQVVGITESQQYQFNPSIFTPRLTWDRVRSQQTGRSLVELVSNIVVIKVDNPAEADQVAQRIMEQVPDVEVVSISKAIQAIPGFSAQQSTLNTQQFFTLLIGMLVIGGFFQIQILQKIPMIGVLKAIGTPNMVVGTAVVLQIVIVTVFGVALGALATGLLALALPANIPIIFNGTSVMIAVATLLAIGPLGGLVSVRLAVSVEPLAALGLSS